MPKIAILAGEASGDLIGAQLMNYLNSKIKNIEIINILGETVLALEDQIPNIIGQYNNTFDISELTKGTYFLKLSTLSYTETSRFVVAK